MIGISSPSTENRTTLIAIHRARTALDAAVEARKLQEQSLEIERAKFDAGASTTYFVMPYESALAQARSTEVASRSAVLKAQAALQRATGWILGDFGISVDGALKNR